MVQPANASFKVCVAPDGRSFFSCGMDGTIKAGKIEVPPALEGFRMATALADVKVLSDSPVAALLMANGSVRVRNLATAGNLASFSGDVAAALAFESFNGEAFVEYTRDKVIGFRRVADRQFLPFLTNDLGRAPRFALSRDGRTLAASDGDRTAVWHIASGAKIKSWPGRSRVLQFSRDGARLLALSREGVTWVLDVPTRQLRELSGQMALGQTLALSRDGRLGATAGALVTVKLHDLTTGREIVAWESIAGNVLCLAFSPDGRRLAAGTDRGFVAFWDLETKTSVGRLRCHDRAPVLALGFIDDEALVTVAPAQARYWRGPNLEKLDRTGATVPAAAER